MPGKINVCDYSIGNHLDKHWKLEGANQGLAPLVEFLEAKKCKDGAIILLERMSKNAETNKKFDQVCASLEAFKDGGFQDNTGLEQFDGQTKERLTGLLRGAIGLLREFSTREGNTDQVVEDFLVFLRELRDGPQKRSLFQSVKNFISWIFAGIFKFFGLRS